MEYFIHTHSSKLFTFMFSFAVALFINSSLIVQHPNHYLHVLVASHGAAPAAPILKTQTYFCYQTQWHQWWKRWTEL